MTPRAGAGAVRDASLSRAIAGALSFMRADRRGRPPRLITRTTAQFQGAIVDPPALVDAGADFSYFAQPAAVDEHALCCLGAVTRRELDPSVGPSTVTRSLALLATADGATVVVSEPAWEAVSWEPPSASDGRTLSQEKC